MADYITKPLLFLLLFLASFDFLHYALAEENNFPDDTIFLFDKVPVDIAAFWLELFSTLFFAATIIFLIKDYFDQEYQTKLQVKQMRDDAYGTLRDHHHDLVRLLLEEPELGVVYNETKKNPSASNELNQDERRIFNFYIAEFDLYERVRRYVDDKDFEGITEEEWVTWLLYLESISKHWLFNYTFNISRQWFGDEVMNPIKEDIIDMQPYAKKYLEVLSETFLKIKIEDLRDENKIGSGTIKIIEEIYQTTLQRKPNKTANICFGSIIESGGMKKEEISQMLSNIKNNRAEMTQPN